MMQVSLGEIPRLPGSMFVVGDAAAVGKERERGNVARIGRRVHRNSQGRYDDLREPLTFDDDGRLAAFRAVGGEVGRLGRLPDAHG